MLLDKTVSFKAAHDVARMKDPAVLRERGLPVATYSQEFAATIFCGVGAHLGSARSQNAMGHILGHVRDTGRG